MTQQKKRFELSTRFDSRKSFYKKAIVEIEGASKTLYSYETPVAMIDEAGKLELFTLWNCSQTTRRHVKEFVKQFNVEDQFLNKVSERLAQRG